ncbi:Sulfur carrier protein adenylyltransferase ThiF [Serinicoccus hydrothermalis]|uniref:Sulfur carrier protein adenylyltransferase ThiF n=1 Tax=Serinicoccus hydrothermalis TaxID=1758689 RepID=A0A1B1NE27_9MICO|nr:ThiF family adenylyltransferase [Serinicoccus hydrothermalis]ANS79641.1 Sulfur carrier protein adenylyltransferase ThiF [Serinicoccus hydrothermalis]
MTAVPPLVEPGPALTPEQVSRYSRHLLVPGMGMTAQRRLLASRVAVVGAGGLGSPVLSYLAAAGVGHLTIIDDDDVDVTNLQRQVIHRSDAVGTAKGASAAGFVRGLNPDVSVEVRHTRITADNALELLRGHDVVLDGADNFPTRYAVSDASVALGIPLVWAAVLRFDAQVSTFVPGIEDAVSLRDLFPVPPRPEDVPSCSEAGVLGALVGQVGSIMAAEAVKLVCGFGEPLVGRVLLIDAVSQRTREVPLRPVGAVVRPVEREHVREIVPLPEVSPQEVRDLLPGVASGGPTLLDVREPAEHELGTVPGALLVPVGEVLSWEEVDHHLPDGPVVVYCKAGPRAQRAAAHLVRLGREDVSVMTGGILGWIEQVDPSLPSY